MMHTEPIKPVEIFYCYAHKDIPLRNNLEKHLSALKRQGWINGWHDRLILAGNNVGNEIDAHITTADIILLLVSPDFIASDYCYTFEMLRALERHHAGKAHVIPIILRTVDLEGTPISKLKALPTGGKAVTSWTNRDDAYFNVAKGIREVISTLSFHRNKDTMPPGHGRIDSKSYKIIDTKEAINRFNHLMQSTSQIKVLGFVGKPKMGKTHLLSKVFPIILKEDYQGRSVSLDLRNKVYTVPDILNMASNQLGGKDVCANYFKACDDWSRRFINRPNSIEGITHEKNHLLTFNFAEDLHKLDDKLLLFLIDSVDASTLNIKTWLMNTLLPLLSSLPHVRVIIAGRSLPEVQISYSAICNIFLLHEVMDEEEYIDFCRNSRVRLEEEIIRSFAYACDYTPGQFAETVLTHFVF